MCAQAVVRVKIDFKKIDFNLATHEAREDETFTGDTMLTQSRTRVAKCVLNMCGCVSVCSVYKSEGTCRSGGGGDTNILKAGAELGF